MTRAEKRRAARQQEKDKVRYQLTAEEIRQIEKKAVESKKEQIRDSIMKEVREEWERREEMLSGKDDGEIVQNVSACSWQSRSRSSVKNLSGSHTRSTRKKIKTPGS